MQRSLLLLLCACCANGFQGWIRPPLIPASPTKRAASQSTAPSTLLGLRLSGGADAPAATALCILAPGFEELEAIAPIDLLRRANVQVTLASTEASKSVLGRNGITVQADTTLDECLSTPYDCVLLPGGPPAVPANGLLAGDARVKKILKDQRQSGKLVSAICAAPSVLKEAGALEGVKYTAHFSVKEQIPDIGPEKVVVDGNVLTSQGAGTSVEFGLALISYLVDQKTADDVAASIALGNDQRNSAAFRTLAHS
eukprot:CAMPEP_0169458520 /NCGR_PEP_ID=MMETSP1042-20121227/17480_1 /TAXON_ID=464988 /ORGANISM="Hemiselmis andersenii, Strain CCMP1180" /LENGTH=254 /DNA_ID=CAMNT_0009570915 /DNA_START=6 /DNA_END=768 /DNA_ORIENTATION=-